MIVKHERVVLTTEARPAFYDITESLERLVEQASIENGIVVAYSQHTTCSVLIQEDSYDVTFTDTKYIMQDLLDVLERIVPECRKEGQYLHPGPVSAKNAKEVVGEPLQFTLNTDAHLRSGIIGRSEAIPIVANQVQLGQFGRVYFADFDGTRERERIVHIQVLGE